MAEILENQILEIEKLVSFRGKVENTDVEKVGKDMESEIVKAGGKRIGYPITVTYGVDGSKVDIELLITVDKKLMNIGKYQYKNRIRIENAIMAKHIGNPMDLQDTCNQLNEYIMKNNFVPITAGYNVPRNINTLNIQDAEVDVYVGISPNIL